MSAAPGHAAQAISFAASDRVQVFADYYSAGSKAKPLILLFHQAGSNRGEYATIAPMLVTLGFNALATCLVNDDAVKMAKKSARSPS